MLDMFSFALGLLIGLFMPIALIIYIIIRNKYKLHNKRTVDAKRLKAFKIIKGDKE
jgi:hypothetical protein